MKVLLVNGSPNENGCTYTALFEVAKALEKEDIQYEIFQLGKKPIPGCIDCSVCRTKGECVFNDKVNEFVEKAKDFDGFVFGSPVYYASANGSLVSFMDRVFHSDKNKSFYLKPAAAVVSARRAGTTAALDQINKYFLISQMPVISSQYWTMVHGYTPEDVQKDLEGLQIMRTLGKNMAWFLKCKQAGEKVGVALPAKEVSISTNFIRD